MPLLRSLPYFFVPSGLIALALFVSIPFFDRVGLPLVVNFPLHFMVILGGLGVVALLLAARERASHETLWDRLWLSRPRLSDVGIGFAVGLVGLGGYVGLQPTVPLLLEAGPWGSPEVLLRLFGSETFLDVPVAGAWWLLGVFGLVYLCNVVGEELWWRGYVLPRQEQALGSIAWLPHATLWTLFHVFFYWDMVALLPIALLISWTCQWRRSVWVGILAHGVLNGVNVIRLWQGVAGG